MQSPPKTVSDLYPSRWLKPQDLRGQAVTVTIKATSFEQFHNPRTNKKEWCTVLDFGRCKRMILNKTQNKAIWQILGTEVFEEWHGHQITLVEGRTPRGQATIQIVQPTQFEDDDPITGEEEE